MEHKVEIGKHPCPCIDLSLEKYKELWQPWRRALIIKVTLIRFKLLEQKVKGLWKLEIGCEMIDLE